MQTEKKTHQQIVQSYIEAYNNFDVEGMLQHMDEQVKFENITDGAVTLSISGKDAFRNQAEQAKGYFRERQQSIIAVSEEADQYIVDINYDAILAIDLPNGLKAGDSLSLTGKSVFTFKMGKIIKLVDIS